MTQTLSAERGAVFYAGQVRGCPAHSSTTTMTSAGVCKRAVERSWFHFIETRCRHHRLRVDAHARKEYPLVTPRVEHHMVSDENAFEILLFNILR